MLDPELKFTCDPAIYLKIPSAGCNTYYVGKATPAVIKYSV